MYMYSLHQWKGYFAEHGTPNAMFACSLVVSLMFDCGYFVQDSIILHMVLSNDFKKANRKQI